MDFIALSVNTEGAKKMYTHFKRYLCKMYTHFKRYLCKMYIPFFGTLCIL